MTKYSRGVPRSACHPSCNRANSNTKAIARTARGMPTALARAHDSCLTAAISERSRSGRPSTRQLLQEARRRDQVLVAVGFLEEPVSLVLRDQVPHLPAIVPHLPHQLLSLRDRHARVILAGDHEQRPADARGIAERRDALQEHTHLRITLVAILLAAPVTAIAGGVAQEGDEIADTRKIDAAAQ